MQPRMLEKYNSEIAPNLHKEFGYANVMQIPKVEKVVINMGLGDQARDSKKLQAALNELAIITGQKPIVTYAKKSIAGFKIREEMALGCKVTLRRNRMYEFLDRLVTIAMPRTRDFRGLNKKSFDGRGNFTMGVKEQIIFPEVDYDKVDTIRGMDISVITTANTDDEAIALLKGFNFPFN